ncbi:MAG: surface lipoprotein assembly modifier, partial [Neisseria sp.]|nr:surface lipoprotein assembly modifier [Neisseria sp.]
ERLETLLDLQSPVLVEKNEAADGKISLSADELSQHPDLVARAMGAAVLYGNDDNVLFLLPYYQKLSPQLQEPALLNAALAVQAGRAQNMSEAVARWRAVLAAQPTWTLARFRLATALYADRQYEAAQAQFEKLRGERLPEPLKAANEQYLQAIAQKNDWNVQGGFTYLNDNNINNAPKNRDLGGGWTAPEAEAGHGIAANVAASKRWHYPAFYHELRVSADGKYYWDNKAYNDLSIRAQTGLGKQTARYEVAVLPFVEQTWYAGGAPNDKSLKRFSRSGGVALEASVRPAEKWQLSTHLEYSKPRYRTRAHLNSQVLAWSNTAFYQQNAHRYWFVGADWQQVSQTRDDDDAFNRRGVRVGWGEDWGAGISTRLTAAYGKKHYRGNALIWNRRQQNNEWTLNASVWHRNLHFKGITPRLTWNYQRVNSNIALYQHQKHRVFVELSKQF